jgi:hypothetical protein
MSREELTDLYQVDDGRDIDLQLCHNSDIVSHAFFYIATGIGTTHSSDKKSSYCDWRRSVRVGTKYLVVKRSAKFDGCQWDDNDDEY